VIDSTAPTRRLALVKNKAYREALAHGLADEVHVLYVSPLKALSNDIRKNLQEPLAGIL
jgi:Lhr-like helicase